MKHSQQGEMKPDTEEDNVLFSNILEAQEESEKTYTDVGSDMYKSNHSQLLKPNY